MRKLALCFLCATALSGASLAFQEVEYTGSLRPELAADRPMIPLKLTAIKDEDKSKLPALAEGESVYASELRVFRGKDKKLVKIFLVETADNKRPPYLYVDVNQDSTITADEKYTFSEANEMGFKFKEATIKFPQTGGLFKSYPLRLGYFLSGKEIKERMVTQSATALAEGKVNIAGRQTLVSYSFDAAGQINAMTGQIGVDCNGDGKIDMGLVSPEIAFAKNETVVFRVDNHYVSTKSVDLATGKIIPRDHPASDYTRIELRVGAEVPDFTFVDFEGNKRKLSEFRGKYLLMDFWGTWCDPCVGEIPNLKEAYEKYRSRGFEILGMDNDESLDKVKKFISEKGVTWTQATTESTQELLSKRFRIVAYPTTILLDPQGKIISVGGAGLMLRGKGLMATLDKLLPAGK